MPVKIVVSNCPYVEQRSDGGTTSFGVHLVCNAPNEQDNSVRAWFQAGQTVHANVRQWRDREKHWADPRIAANETATAAAFDITVKSLLYLGTRDADVRMGCHAGEQSSLLAATKDVAAMPMIHPLRGTADWPD